MTAPTNPEASRPKPQPPLGGSGISRDFSSEDAATVCYLLRNGKNNPDLYTREERAAVSRLYGMARVFWLWADS